MWQFVDQANFEQLKHMLINSYVSQSESMENGYMLVDTSYKILAVNEFCKKYFKLNEYNETNSIKMFERLNDISHRLMNPRIYDLKKLLKENNSIINNIHLMVYKLNSLVNFIFFILYEQKFISLLINVVPVTDCNGAVKFIQFFFSQYDFWGYANMSEASLFNRTIKEVPYITLNETKESLPVKLSMRQQEIVFLLAQGLGMRHTAELLRMSYGSLVSALRNSIYIKFKIHDNNVDLLIAKLIKFGYNKLRG